MKLPPLLAALALCAGAAQAQTDDTPPAPAPPSMSLSAFEAIQPPPTQESVPVEPASQPMAAVRLRLDPDLSAPPPPPADEAPAEPPPEAN